MTRVRLVSLLALVLLLSPRSGARSGKGQPTMAEKIKRFVPTELGADISRLSENDRKALGKLVQAAGLMDSIYLRQAWGGNAKLIASLRSDDSPEGADLTHYFNINMGPWSKLDQDQPFIEGVPPIPPGANYYPEDMGKDEFTSWVETLPEDKRREATGFYTVVRRDGTGKLFTRPFSEEYREYLEPAAALLKEAALLTESSSLKTFLILRANAFLTNDYYQSEVAWMDIDGPLEPTIGPYEVYLDDMFNYKAAFEAFITIRDEGESAKLDRFSGYLQEIENHLPIDLRYRNPSLGALSPIRVVDEVAIGGEARAGVQTSAYNLPNDERVTKEKGSKRVLLKNVQEAKFKQILIPIAFSAVDNSLGSLVDFEPFFTHILAHELMHGLGPHSIVVDGRETTVREEMRELSSALEEAKADVSGLFALQYLIDSGVLEKTLERQLYATYLAGLFRSVRFGTKDAHGLGSALQFNYLEEQGAFKYDAETKTYGVDFEAIKPAVSKLTGEIMTLQARGDYNGAKELLKTYGRVKPEMQGILDKLSDIPVDIEPLLPSLR
jgi:hypothetical protein